MRNGMYPLINLSGHMTVPLPNAMVCAFAPNGHSDDNTCVEGDMPGVTTNQHLPQFEPVLK